jgi:hypothetical protein
MSTLTATETASRFEAGSEAIELQPIKVVENADTDHDRTLSEDTALTRINLLRVLAASLSFFFAGNNDGSLGALTPYILRTYDVGTEYVALM